MHAWEHACTQSGPGKKNMIFFIPGARKNILNPDFGPQKQPKCKATCVSFNLRHFGGQMVEFEEIYSNFSESHLRNFWP